jgi:capsular polysaccharide transport system permease protein
MPTNVVTPQGSLRSAFVIQMRVMHALLMRDVITRFGRENLGVLWLVGEPMLFTVGVATIWSAIGMHHNSPIPIVAFAVTGYSSVLMWRNSTSRAGSAVNDTRALMFHRRVKVIDVLLMRVLLETSGATSSFFVLSCFFMYIGWMRPPQDLLQVLGGWLMLTWFAFGLATLVGSASALSEVVERLWHPISYLMFPLSGAAFMVSWLPQGFQQVVMYVPMVHGVEIVREGWFGDVVPPHYDVRYMAACCLVISFAALCSVHYTSRHVKQH